MTFYDWLMRHTEKDSPLGDLADDVKRDREFPKDLNTRERLLHHMICRHACHEAIDTAKQAWVTYRNYLKRHEAKA